MIEDVEVAVAGGGPAGAIVAAHLARAGHEVVLLERAPAWRWRACGVFASPAARTALARIGLDDRTLERVAAPIPAMRLETRGGARVRLTYGDDGSLGASAVGFDRSSLDPALLALARREGADVRPEVTLTGGDLAGHPELALRGPTGPSRLRARVVIGADGIRSTVARLAGGREARPARRADRALVPCR